MPYLRDPRSINGHSIPLWLELLLLCFMYIPLSFASVLQSTCLTPFTSTRADPLIPAPWTIIQLVCHSIRAYEHSEPEIVIGKHMCMVKPGAGDGAIGGAIPCSPCIWSIPCSSFPLTTKPLPHSTTFDTHSTIMRLVPILNASKAYSTNQQCTTAQDTSASVP